MIRSWLGTALLLAGCGGQSTSNNVSPETFEPVPIGHDPVPIGHDPVPIPHPPEPPVSVEQHQAQPLGDVEQLAVDTSLDVALDERFAYFVSTPHDLQVPWSGHITRVDKANGASSVIVDGLLDPRSVFALGDYLYWGDMGDGTLGRARLDGTERTTFARDVGGPIDIAVDDTYVWVADVLFNRILRVDPQGTVVAVSIQHYPYTTMLFGNELYTANCTNENPLVSQIVALGRGERASLFSEQPGWAIGLQEQGGSFYWLNWQLGNSTLRRIDLTSQDISILATSTAQAIALGVTRSSAVLGMADGLFRVDIEGGALERLTGKSNTVRTLAVDDEHAYYSDFSGSYRVPL